MRDVLVKMPTLGEPVKTPIRGALLCAFFLFGAGAAAQGELGIAAVVNDEVISLHDLNGRLSLVIATSRLEDRPTIRRRLAPQVLRNLIDEQLKLQEAKRLRIRVTQAEIDGAITRIETSNNFGDGGLSAFLAGRGIDMPILLGQIEAEIAWVKLVTQSSRQKISMSDDEIDETMAEIGANKGMPEFLASEIFLRLESPDQERDVRLLADRLLQQLGSGADFDTLARNFSHSGTAAIGGDLGWVQRGQIDEPALPSPRRDERWADFGPSPFAVRISPVVLARPSGARWVGGGRNFRVFEPAFRGGVRKTVRVGNRDPNGVCPNPRRDGS